MQLAIAMFTHAGSLSAKLQAIWGLAPSLVERVEGRRKDKLKKMWGKYWGTWLDQPSPVKQLLTRSAMVRRGLFSDCKVAKPSDQWLFEPYLGLLEDFEKINQAFKHIQQDELEMERLFGLNRGTTERLEVYAPVYLKSQKFLDRVVPHFFSLQIRCYALQLNIATAPGVPADPRERRNRASAGGEGALRGQVEFKSMVLNCLREESGTRTFKSLAELGRTVAPKFNQVLRRYNEQREREGWNYGSTLKPENISEKILSWKFEPEFRDVFGSLVPSWQPSSVALKKMRLNQSPREGADGKATPSLDTAWRSLSDRRTDAA